MSHGPRRGPELLGQRSRGALGHRGVRYVGQRRIAPQRACLRQQPGGFLGVAAVQRFAAALGEHQEVIGIQLARLHDDLVTGRMRLHPFVPAEHAPHVAHPHPQRRVSIPRSQVSPEGVYQQVLAGGLGRVQQQHREGGALQ